jgi:hypothetical protein
VISACGSVCDRVEEPRRSRLAGRECTALRKHSLPGGHLQSIWVVGAHPIGSADMARERLRTGLQVALTILGSVAVIAGSVTLIFGAASVVGVEDPTPAADSEMRFFAAWYAAAGVALLRVIPRVETQGNLIRGIAVVFFIAGCARGLSWVVIGEPPGVAMLLLGIELALPFVIIPWQASVERTATGSRPGTGPP